MLRARFLIFLIALILGRASGAHAQQSTPKKRPPGLLPSRAPVASEALRYPPARRPPSPPRPETVPLPYNMVWGDSQSRLASLFAGVGATVINKKSEGKTETWTVQGLLAADLQASLFTFQDHILAALEFDYGRAEWDTTKFNDKMGQLRKLLESQFGFPGEMVSRPSDEQPSMPDGVKQSLMGYQWKRGDTLAQLFYFAAEDPAKALSYRSISVHYHYQEQSVLPLDETPLPGMENANPDANPLFGGKARNATAPPEPIAAPSPGPALIPTPAMSPTPGPSPSLLVAPDAEPTPIPSPTPEPTDGKGKRKAKPTPPPYDPLPQ